MFVYGELCSQGVEHVITRYCRNIRNNRIYLCNNALVCCSYAFNSYNKVKLKQGCLEFGQKDAMKDRVNLKTCCDNIVDLVL